METIHVKQRLRPATYAFVVRDNDTDGFLRATAINSAIWGGMYNPIVPFEPAEEREALLKTFDPDFIVDLAGAGAQAFGDDYRHRVFGPDELTTTHHRTNQPRLAVGFNIYPIIDHVYEKEVRFLTAAASRAALVAPNAEDMKPYVQTVYGGFDGLPNQEIDFHKIYTRGLRAQQITFDPTAPAAVRDILSPIHFTRYGLTALRAPRRL